MNKTDITYMSHLVTVRNHLQLVVNGPRRYSKEQEKKVREFIDLLDTEMVMYVEKQTDLTGLFTDPKPTTECCKSTGSCCKKTKTPSKKTVEPTVEEVELSSEDIEVVPTVVEPVKTERKKGSFKRVEGDA